MSSARRKFRRKFLLAIYSAPLERQRACVVRCRGQTSKSRTFADLIRDESGHSTGRSLLQGLIRPAVLFLLLSKLDFANCTSKCIESIENSEIWRTLLIFIISVFINLLTSMSCIYFVNWSVFNWNYLLYSCEYFFIKMVWSNEK